MSALLRALFAWLLLGGAAAASPSAERALVVADFEREPDLGPGAPLRAWMEQHGWRAEFGTPLFFFLHKGALHLVARRGPALLPWKREDKVILRITGDDFRVPAGRRLEVAMAPLRLPGKGADLSDSDKNDACFYLLVGFDGPLHRYQGTPVPDTVGYVWADGPWKSAGEVGRDPDYDRFLRYLALGRGEDRLGQLRTFVRDPQADYRLAFPERSGAVPDVVRVGLMIDANTVKSEAESMVRSIRFLP